MDRRSFLRSTGVIATGALAGCSAINSLTGGGGKFKNAGDDAWSSYTFQPSGAQFVAAGQFSLEPGQYTARGISASINISLTFNFDINSGNGVDFLIVRSREWEAFRNRNDPEISYGYPIDRGTTMASTDVNNGQFFAVLDNTSFGEKGSGGNTSAGTMELTGRPL